MITPAEFIAKWGPGGPAAHLNEEQGAQQHFLELCELLGVPKPSNGDTPDYVFEQRSLVLGAARGYADVFYRGHFAWENKAPGKNLDAALRQLQQYALALSNPPLLVVCDRLTIRIHTQFNGYPSERHEVRIEQLDRPEQRALLARLWTDPESFKPPKSSRAITEEAARAFATLAEQLRGRGGEVQQVAHFLTQCIFCFFAEDVGLLPGRMFERLVDNRHLGSAELVEGLADLFATMRKGGRYGPDSIPWFNGGLFEHVAVPALEVTDVSALRNAAALNWSAIDVSIFGTLFERGLDPAKRSQLGAHYTDPATIARIIEPVVTRPLLARWEQAKSELRPLAQKIRKNGDTAYGKAHARFVAWLEELRAFRILDPACGSGNFLFLGLKALKDVELLAITEAATLGLDREQDLVTGPHNVLGIELNRYAAELARASIWIGELQWRIAHGYPYKTNPVLEPLNQIECRDALLAWVGEGDARKAVEAEWPKADVVVGNPPFLGGSKKRGELGDVYFGALNAVFAQRVPGFADLVCYWFEKSRERIEQSQLTCAGLVSTNSIRGGANRKVLDAIVQTTRIFDAWADEPWVNDGAAVRVSLVCFGAGSTPVLDGCVVARIAADLTPSGDGGADDDLTKAQRLPMNFDTSFQGPSKKGSFDVPGNLARSWLGMPNPNGRPNIDVVKPWQNGRDIVQHARDMWIVDYGTSMSEQDASLYESPFQHLVAHVKPERAKNNREAYRKFWWRHAEARVAMRSALVPLTRYIATVRVSKHRLFVWADASVLPDDSLIVIARADDTTFGILHSRFHECWSLRMCTWLGVGNDPRYTPTTCFETFPFPASLTPQDTAGQKTEALASGAQIPAGLQGTELQSHASAIAEAAHHLDALRRNWLNPPEWTCRVPEVVPLGMDHSPYPDRIEPRPGLGEADARALKKRTLTHLYNQRPAWLAQAHAQLDAAVAAAYGWADYTPAMPEDEILRRLLALNLARAG